MMETYSVLFRGFIKLSKNLLAFATHWIANTNKGRDHLESKINDILGKKS